MRYGTGNSCGGGSKIFLNTIAEDVPASATRFNLTTNTTVNEWLNPAIAAENVTGLVYNPSSTPVSPAGSFSFSVNNYIGNATLSIDVNNNGVYTDAIDRLISTGVQQGANTVAFDGKDGTGVDIPCASTVKAKVVLDRQGEIHFVLSDAEGLGGIKITRTTGAGSPSSVISWDDSNVSTPRDTYTPALVGTNINSSLNNNIHGWARVNNSDRWRKFLGKFSSNRQLGLPSRFDKSGDYGHVTLPGAGFRTPTTDIDELSFFTDGTSRDFIVNLYEIENVPATGQIRLRLTKLTAFTITYPTTNTVSNVFGGISNENGNWTFTETQSFITATAKAGITIPANGQALIGFNITRKVGTPPGNSQNITATIIGGSGGEINTTNNQVVTTVTAQ